MIIELLCLAILLFGAWRGWRNGLVKEVIYLTSFFIGLWLAYHYYKDMGGGILGFLLVWIGVPIVLGCLAWLITKVLDEILVIGTVNKLMGAAVGFLKYAFLLGCLVMVINYCREVKEKYEDHPLVKALQTVPNALFPDVQNDDKKTIDEGE